MVELMGIGFRCVPRHCILPRAKGLRTPRRFMFDMAVTDDAERPTEVPLVTIASC